MNFPPMKLIHRLTIVAIVAIVELISFTSTRAVLHFYSWSSESAELIRSAFRIVSTLIYWQLFKPVILSRKFDYSSLKTLPALLPGAILLFLSIPILLGRYHLPGRLAVLFAITSLAVAVKEEFLFRGIIQNVLTERFSNVKAIIATSLIFTLWHIGAVSPGVWQYSQIFFASVLLGLIYWQTGSLAIVIAIHTTYDALFAFTPLIPNPLNKNWGFVPLFGSVFLTVLWAFNRNRILSGEVKDI